MQSYKNSCTVDGLLVTSVSLTSIACGSLLQRASLCYDFLSLPMAHQKNKQSLPLPHTLTLLRSHSHNKQGPQRSLSHSSHLVRQKLLYRASSCGSSQFWKPWLSYKKGTRKPPHTLPVAIMLSRLPKQPHFPNFSHQILYQQ